MIPKIQKRFEVSTLWMVILIYDKLCGYKKSEKFSPFTLYVRVLGKNNAPLAPLSRGPKDVSRRALLLRPHAP